MSEQVNIEHKSDQYLKEMIHFYNIGKRESFFVPRFMTTSFYKAFHRQMKETGVLIDSDDEKEYDNYLNRNEDDEDDEDDSYRDNDVIIENDSSSYKRGGTIPVENNEIVLRDNVEIVENYC
jgi:exonuclease V gamma subunit